MITNKDAFWIGHYAADGNDALAVAGMLGLPADRVAEVMQGYVAPVVLPGWELSTVELAAKHRTRIAAEAKARGIYIPDLASLTLQAVARDNLFSAVIDG